MTETFARAVSGDLAPAVHADGGARAGRQRRCAGATRRLAQAKELVLVNWGGDAITAYDAAYGQPFKKRPASPSRRTAPARPKARSPRSSRAASRPGTWSTSIRSRRMALGKKGMIEPIDYAIVDKAKMREGFGWEHAASTYFFSYIIAYDSRNSATRRRPAWRTSSTWRNSPASARSTNGARACGRRHCSPTASRRHKLYPLDLKRAHDKIAAFKENVVSYWGGGAESQSVLLNGEASMAIIWSTRASLIEKDSGGKIKFIWDQGLISPGALAVLKGNPGGKDAAMKFIASAQDPEEAADHVRDARPGPGQSGHRRADPRRTRSASTRSIPANMNKQIPLDMAWYAEELRAGAGRIHEDHLGWR